MLDDEQEACEVEHLIAWWNRYVHWIDDMLSKLTLILICRRIFPHSSPQSMPAPVEGSALDRIRQKRAEIQERQAQA
jgi:hypothetical protein